jgi:hypothetical protein
MKVRILRALPFSIVALAMALPVQTARATAPPTPAAADALKETLTRLERASWDAWQHRDGSYFETFLSDDHVEVGVAGPARKATIVAGVASPSCVVKSFAIDTFALTTFDPNTALLTYHAQQDTTCAGVAVPSPVWASSLYVKRGGRWRNALYQQTRAAK